MQITIETNETNLSIHGESFEGNWIAYSPHARRDATGEPEVSFGPFANRDEVIAFALRMPHLVCVNLSDFPKWLNR